MGGVPAAGVVVTVGAPGAPGSGATPDLQVRGGRGDPAGVHVVDVESVHRAAVAYVAAADRIGVQAVGLRRLPGQVVAAAPGPAEAVTAPWLLLGLLGFAARLDRLAEARRDLAQRSRRAVILYAQVDADNAVRFRRLLTGQDRSPWAGLPPGTSPWTLERDGLCTTTPIDDDRAADRPPACPGFHVDDLHPEHLYGAQRLEINSVTTVPPRTTWAPGLAGILAPTHAAYAATAPDGTEIDVIDVHRRDVRTPEGAVRTSYVVALPGTTEWDPLDLRLHDERRFRSMRPNLEGAFGRASAEAALLPDVLARAGVPPGAEVLLVGHSQGGLTAVNAAALPAMRRYRLQVVTAGSPVGRSPVVPSVSYLHVATRGDVVPAVEGVPNRPTPNQVTVTVGEPRDPRAAHDLDTYEAELGRVDRARASGATLPAALEDSVSALERAGHLTPRGAVEEVTTVRISLRRH